MMIIIIVIFNIIITMESVISNLWTDCAGVALLGLLRPKVENAFTRSTSQPVEATYCRKIYITSVTQVRKNHFVKNHLLMATTLCA